MDLFSAEDMVAILFPHLYDGQTHMEDEEMEDVADIIKEALDRNLRVNAAEKRRECHPIASTSRT